MLTHAHLWAHHVVNPDHICITFVVHAELLEELNTWSDLLDAQFTIDPTEVTGQCPSLALGQGFHFYVTVNFGAGCRERGFGGVGQFAFCETVDCCLELFRIRACVHNFGERDDLVFDWAIIYMPFELFYMGPQISTIGGKNVSKEAYNCYQVILMQVTFFMYLKNTNVQVIYSLTTLGVLTFIGIAMIFDDDGLIGTTQLFTCPVMLLQLLFQILMLSLRNTAVEIISKLVFKRYSNLLDWYADVEERLSFEEYEDPN